MDPGQSPNVEAQIAELTARVYRLEKTLKDFLLVGPNGELVKLDAHPAEAHPPEPAIAHPTPAETPAFAQTPQPFAPFPEQLPQSTYDLSRPVKPAEDHSLESRIGSQWFNRIGILAILISAAWFLKFAFDNHWIGPLGRILIGLLAGAALIAWSERFQRGGYKLFAYSLKAIGSGILYLSLWAAFSVYHLIPSSAAFAAMILVTAFNGFMAWLQDAELLALYAIVGGLSTPLLLSTGENHEVILFSYILLLDFAVLILVALRPWSRLLVMAFAGTVLFYVGWYSSFYSDAQFAPTASFLTCFFLLFAFSPRLAQLPAEQQDNPTGWNIFALVLLPVGTALFGFLAFYILLDPPSGGWAGAWLAVAFAAFYLLLLRLPAIKPLRPSPSVLSGLHLTAAIVLLTIAIPLKTHGRALTIGWLVEGAALLWVGTRVPSRLVRGLSIVCLLLGLAALIAVNPTASTTPLFNQRFGTYLVAILCIGFASWIANRIGEAQIKENPDATPEWFSVAAVAAITVNALILLAIGWEIHSYWWLRSWHSDIHAVPGGRFVAHPGYRIYREFRIYAQFTYSAFFMFYGAFLLAVGFLRRSAFLRWQALLLLAVTVGKVFLWDVSQLSQGYRILSFFGIGALLLAVSYVYQRDLLHLRNANPERHQP